MKCTFCGFEYEPSESHTGCSSCPLGKSCTIYCCPSCGYREPPEGKLISWFRKKTENRRSRKKSQKQGDLI